MQEQRNGIIDFWKFIAAIGVILVHIPLPGVYGKIGTAVGVCGVGFFYIISGYACYGPDKNVMCSKIMKRFRRNGIITIIAVAVYFLFAFLVTKLYGNRQDLLLFKQYVMNPVTYLRMILLGDFEFIYGSALWFMVALLYCYLIFYVIVRFELKKLVYVLTPIFLILRIVVDSYVNSYPVSWHISANVIIGALPMMLLGYVIADKKESLCKISNPVLIISCIVSAALMFLAVNFKAGKIDISQPFKILCGASIFVCGIKNSGRHILKPIEKLGREDSLYIYLCHFLIIVILSELIYSFYYNEKVLSWLLPLLVIIVSIIVARFLSIIVRACGKCFAKASREKEES
ncbi:MAG: acyltransferase [Treponema sp.]|nr:acyltransferase [Treponema sp.]